MGFESLGLNQLLYKVNTNPEQTLTNAINNSLNSLSITSTSSSGGVGDGTSSSTTPTVYADYITDGNIKGNLFIENGFIRSKNYVTGTTGWTINADGSVEFSNGVFRGSITASSGLIGGFNIASTYINDVANSFGLSSAVTAGDDIRIWAGSTLANFATAPFRVTEAGVLTASSGTVGGWTLSATKLSCATIDIDATNAYIVSSNYQTGVSGFKISSTLMEAENGIFRGTMRGATFAYDRVSAIGGQLMVTNADTLASDMTALDASTMTIKGDTTFAVNDILVIRGVATSGIQEEWFRVTNIASAPTYTVTRDIKGDYTANNNPAWKAGTPVVKQGKSDGASTYSGGWLRLIGEGTNAPYYSVFARNGIAYNAYTEAVRMGNLNGIGTNNTDKFGIYIGDTSTYLQYDPTGGLVLQGSFSVNSAYTATSALAAGDVCEQSTAASECQPQTIDDVGFNQLFDVTTLPSWASQFKICQLNATTYVGAYYIATGIVGIALFKYTNGKMIRGYTDITTISDMRSPYTITGIIRLSSDKVLVAYDGENSGTLITKVSVITINADLSLTIAASVNMTNFNLSQNGGKLVRMGDNKFMIIGTISSSFYLYAICCTVSGTTITVGNYANIANVGTFFDDAVFIDTDKVLICFGNVVYQVLTVSGTTITEGTEYSPTGTSYNFYGELDKISTTKAISFYKRNTTNNDNATCKLYSRILNISGSAITFGAEVEVVSSLINIAFNRFNGIYFQGNKSLAFYALTSPNDLNTYGKYLAFDGSDNLTVSSQIISDSMSAIANFQQILDRHLDYQTDFDFLTFSNKKYLNGMFFKASKKAVGFSPTAISASSSVNLVNKGLISGLSGYTVGQEIRDKFDNRVVAVAKTTTSINVL